MKAVVRAHALKNGHSRRQQCADVLGMVFAGDGSAENERTEDAGHRCPRSSGRQSRPDEEKAPVQKSRALLPHVLKAWDLGGFDFIFGSNLPCVSEVTCICVL